MNDLKEIPQREFKTSIKSNQNFTSDKNLDVDFDYDSDYSEPIKKFKRTRRSNDQETFDINFDDKNINNEEVFYDDSASEKKSDI